MARPRPLPPAARDRRDAAWLRDALRAGIHRVIADRDHINRINVFPVPDGDTGTNMAFTFKTILEATESSPDRRVEQGTHTPRPPTEIHPDSSGPA